MVCSLVYFVLLLFLAKLKSCKIRLVQGQFCLKGNKQAHCEQELFFDSSYKNNNSVIPLNKIFTKAGSPICMNILFAFSSYFFHNSNKQTINLKIMQNYINIYQICLLSFKFSFQNPHNSTPYDCILYTQQQIASQGTYGIWFYRSIY